MNVEHEIDAAVRQVRERHHALRYARELCAGRAMCNEHADREKWKVERTKRVTASDVSLVLGLAPDWMDRTLADVYAEKKQDPTYDGEQFKGNDTTDAGNYGEPWIIQAARDRFGWAVHRWGDHIADKHCEHLAATPDAFVWTWGGPAVVQVKRTKARGNAERIKNKQPTGEFYGWVHEGVPDYYRTQVQTELACTGWDHGFVLAWHVFDEGRKNGERKALIAHYVPRDEELITKIRNGASAFWRDYVEAE